MNTRSPTNGVTINGTLLDSTFKKILNEFLNTWSTHKNYLCWLITLDDQLMFRRNSVTFDKTPALLINTRFFQRQRIRYNDEEFRIDTKTLLVIPDIETQEEVEEGEEEEEVKEEAVGEVELEPESYSSSDDEDYLEQSSESDDSSEDSEEESSDKPKSKKPRISKEIQMLISAWLDLQPRVSLSIGTGCNNRPFPEQAWFPQSGAQCGYQAMVMLTYDERDRISLKEKMKKYIEGQGKRTFEFGIENLEAGAIVETLLNFQFEPTTPLNALSFEINEDFLADHLSY
jgi:hypothetical protein